MGTTKRPGLWSSVAAIVLASSLIGLIVHVAPAGAKLPGSSIKPNPGGSSSGGGSGTVTSVTATAPFSISSTPTTTPNVTSSGAGLSLLGRSANSTGVLDMITCSSDGGVFRRSGTAVGCGSIVEGSVTNLTSDLAALTPLTRTITGTAPVTVDGDNSAHDLSSNRTIALASMANGTVLGNVSGSSAAPVALPTLKDPWFTKALQRVQTYDATLTDVIVMDEAIGPGGNWVAAQVTTGTVVINGPSTVDLQSGTTSGGIALLQIAATATGTTSKPVTNLRTAHYALCVRVTKIASVAGSVNRMVGFSDGVGSNLPYLGIIGGTSTSNYSVKVGSATAVDTTVAQSAVGTYDTLCGVNDGTNFKVDINFAAPGAGASTAVGTIVANAGYPELQASITSGSSNSGFRLDKIMFILPGAN